MKDYCAIARQYEADVLSGVVPACKWVRLAIARNVRDLQRAAAGDAAFPYDFSPGLARGICLTAERLPHIKGPKAKVVGKDDQGRPIWANLELEPHQCWFLTTLFGWVRRGTSLRRFRVALYMVPRKNAKSTLAAVVVIFMLCADGESGAECYSAATTRDQAKTIAEIVWEMVKRSPGLREYFGVKLGAKTTRAVEVPSTASRFLPLSADAHTLDSLNVHLAAVDELHAHKTRDVWGVLDTATAARLQSLLLATTTAGVEIEGICYEQREYLHKVLEGVFQDEAYFGVEYTIDEGDDWRLEATWKKANPNWGASVQPDDIARKAQQAEQSPPALANFQTKHLNMWVHASFPCLSLEGWRQGQSDWEEDELLHEPCFVGVDLASQIDLCALSYVFPPAETRPTWRIIQRLWTPEETLRDRAHRDRAPYDVWVKQGWLAAPAGTALDHDLVRQEILRGRDRFTIRQIGFDPWHATQPIHDLTGKDGFSAEQVIAVPQTYAGMSAACLKMQAAILAGQVDARRCPVTAWSVSNVVANRDGKDNLMFAKGKSRGRIDPVISATIGVALWLRQPVEKDFTMLVFGR